MMKVLGEPIFHYFEVFFIERCTDNNAEMNYGY